MAGNVFFFLVLMCLMCSFARVWPDRNVCLWDTLVTPANSLVHGEKLHLLCFLLLSVHLFMNRPPLDSLLINPTSLPPPPSFLLSWLWGHGAGLGPQAPAAYHWWEEGLDQHAGPPPQAPAAKLPGPRLAGQSAGRGPHRGLLHQRLVGGQHQGISDPLAPSSRFRPVFGTSREAKS